MNELSVVPKTSNLPAAVTQALTSSELRYVSLREGEKVSQMPTKEVSVNGIPIPIVPEIKDLIGSVFYKFAREIHDDDLIGYAGMMTRELSQYYPSTTIDEVREAMTLGSSHAFGEVHPLSLSVALFIGWLVKFQALPDRSSAIAKRNQLLAKKAEAEVTDEQLKTIADESLRQSYRAWKSAVEFNAKRKETEEKKPALPLNYGNAIYRILVSRKLIADDLQAFIPQAREILNAELIESRQIAKEKLHRNVVAKIEADLMEIESDTNSRITSLAGTLAVRKHFEYLKTVK